MKTKEIKLILKKEVDIPDGYEAVADWRLPGDGELFLSVDRGGVINSGPLHVCRPVLRKKEPWKCTGLWAGTGCWLCQDEWGFKLSSKMPEFDESDKSWRFQNTYDYLIIDDTDTGLTQFIGMLPQEWWELPDNERIVQL